MRVRDHTGQRYGRLTVLYQSRKTSRGDSVWACRCDCGKEKTILGNNLGNTKSCGCLRRGQLKTHGMSSTSTYISWKNMIARCTDPNHPDYSRYYGGRGIKVCERWLRFENFLEDMGDRPCGLTLERKDNDSDYCPENCIWATRATQNRNRRNNVILSAFGETAVIEDWVKRLNITRKSIKEYLARGKSLEWIIQYFASHRQAILTPDQVKEIRSTSGFTSARLAEKYGVSPSTIRAVQKGITWKHVQ